MSLTGFENYHVGDCLSFVAEVYRYIKTSRGKMIDFGLKDPAGIRKVGEYEVPLDEQLRIQATEQIVCTDLCMFRDHCDGFCIANQEWKESIKCHSTYFPFFSIFFIVIITLKKRYGEKEINHEENI